jgi:hypothetical protein
MPTPLASARRFQARSLSPLRFAILGPPAGESACGSARICEDHPARFAMKQGVELGNEEVIAMFRDWWLQRNLPVSINGELKRLISDDLVEASFDVIRRFAQRIDPVSLAECTIAELKEFQRRGAVRSEMRTVAIAVEMFGQFRKEVLRKSRKRDRCTGILTR